MYNTCEHICHAHHLPPQVRLLHAAGEVPDAIGGPLHTKYYMYVGFLFLVLCNVVLEITLHALLNNYGKMWLVLTVYEVCDLVICGLIFFIFRPRNHSPFFFMVPATLNDTRTRPIPIIEAIDDDSELAEIEIAPLLGAQRNPNNSNSNDKMVIIRNPGGDVMVGMSPVMQTRSHHGGSGARDPQRGRGYVSNSARGNEMQRQGSSGESFENRLLRGIDSLPPRNNTTGTNSPPPQARSGRVGVSPSLGSRGQELLPNFGHDDNAGHDSYGGANGGSMERQPPPPSSSTVQMTSYY